MGGISKIRCDPTISLQTRIIRVCFKMDLGMPNFHLPSTHGIVCLPRFIIFSLLGASSLHTHTILLQSPVDYFISGEITRLLDPGDLCFPLPCECG